MENEIKKIQVLGSGCPTCKKLLESAQKAVNDLRIDVKIDYVNDYQEIMKSGIMSLPALTINDQIISAGNLPNTEKIKELISNYQAGKSTPTSKCGCSGCGSC
ncbi:MAG: thioredoxin family protein [Candidatus Buchananbacteria bacterium]